MIASRDPEYPIGAHRGLAEHPNSSARLDAGFSDTGISDTGISVVAISSGATQNTAASRGIDP
jgi:hypothetical protein